MGRTRSLFHTDVISCQKGSSVQMQRIFFICVKSNDICLGICYISKLVLWSSLLPKPKYEIVEEQGITFFFKHDKAQSSLLHIYVRHLTTIDDALDVFFNTTPVWNEKYTVMRICQKHTAFTGSGGACKTKKSP